MKNEIKTNDSNANRNSLFTLNKNLNKYPSKILITEDKHYIKINPVKETLQEKTIPNRKYSDKTNNKEKDFNSKLKNFIKQNNSNSIASINNNNDSRIFKKENSLIRNKPIFLTRNQSKLTNFSTRIQNNNDLTDFGYITTKTVEQINLETNSCDFNTIENFDADYTNNNNLKSNLDKKENVDVNLNQFNFNCYNEYTNKQEIYFSEENLVKENTKAENKNNIKKDLNTASIDNFKTKNRGSFFNRRSAEKEKISLLVKKDKNDFDYKLKTDVIYLNNSCEDARKEFNKNKDSLISNKRFVHNNFEKQSTRKGDFSTSKNKGNSRKIVNNSQKKNNENLLINFKNKTANKDNNINEIGVVIKRIPNLNLLTLKYNKVEQNKKFIVHINKVKLKKQPENFLELNNSAEKTKKNLSIVGFNNSKNLKTSKSQNKILKSNLNSSNENFIKETEKKSIRIKNHVKIIDENENNNYTNNINNNLIKNDFTNEEKKSSKSFRNLSTKSVFFYNQSNKFLINLLNSSESSYADKFTSIVEKYKTFVSGLINFLSLNEDTDNNISIFKNASNLILNASFTNSQVNFTELSNNYCEESKTDCADLNVFNLANNLEKNIKFQIDDVLLGISPILLDCNIIKQEFIESNFKSRKNVVFAKLDNQKVIEENLEQIAFKSEQRSETIKIIFKEMKDNLSEVSNLLVNDFGENFNRILEEFKIQNCEEIIKMIQKLNNSKNLSNNAQSNNDYNNYAPIGFRDNSAKNRSIKIRKTSKVIEIDLSNNKNKLDGICNKISDNRRSLMEILQSEENSEYDDINYLKTDSNEKTISNILKAEIEKNKIIEADPYSESSEKSLPGKVLFTEESAVSEIKKKKDEKQIKNVNLVSSKNRKSYKDSVNNKKDVIGNIFKLSKVTNFKIKNIEIAKSELADKPRKLAEPKTNSVSVNVFENSLKRNKISTNENKENNKKLMNKNNLENIRIDSTIELSSNEKIEEKSNQKLQIQQETESLKLENKKKFELSKDENLNTLPEKIDSKNLINNSNYININVNINPIERRNTIEYKIIQNLNMNQTLNSINNNNIKSKSENNLSNLDANNLKSRNANKKFNFEIFPNANICYAKFMHLANQRKSKLENKMKQDIHKRMSLSRNTIEESDMMASVDEFDSDEKAHMDIPLSAINYAHMPICGSRIIRRHSSFSKVLQKFNYKRFFNFRKSSFFSPSKNIAVKNIISSNNNNINNYSNLNNNLNCNSNKSIKNNNYNIYKSNDKSSNTKDNNSNSNSNNEEKVTPEIKDFNLKKIEVFDSGNYSDMNSSAPDLSISVSEVCNDLFHCCDNIEIKDKFSFINFNKQSVYESKNQEKKKRRNPDRRKSRSVMNLMIVNVNK